MKSIEYNAKTGEITERELTQEEIVQMNVENVLSNSDTASLRQQAYKDRSDSFYLAWQKYLATDDDRASEAKQIWLDEVAKIDEEFPYNE